MLIADIETNAQAGIKSESSPRATDIKYKDVPTACSFAREMRRGEVFLLFCFPPTLLALLPGEA